MNDNFKLTYTLDQAADAINVSRPIMSELIHRKNFPAIKVGRKWLIPIRSLELWLEKQACLPTETDNYAS